LSLHQYHAVILAFDVAKTRLFSARYGGKNWKFAVSLLLVTPDVVIKYCPENCTYSRAEHPFVIKLQ